MPSVTTGIDHPVIAVRDMQAARRTYARLGFTIPPRGSHLAWGTGNWCIMFPHDYLELRGVLDPSQPSPHLEAVLQQGEGLMGTALATDDAEASFDELRRRGFQPTPVRQLARNFELPEGTVQPRFSLCFLDALETSGLMSVVFCQHLTPELLRQPSWLNHENGAQAVHALTCVVADLDEAAARLTQLFDPHPIVRQDDSLQIDFTGRGRVVATTRSSFERYYPNCHLRADPAGEFLAAVSIAVNDIHACRELLESRGVEVVAASEKSFCIAPEEACGALLEFSAANV